MRLLRALALACAFGAWLANALAAEGGAPPRAAAPWSRGLLFRLERPGAAPSYVFGTVHSADPRVLALAPPVREAFTSTRTLALENRLGEGDLDDVFAAAQFDDGRRLDAFFEPATIAAIRLELAGAVADEATVMRLKPWAIVLKLAERPAPHNGAQTLDPFYGERGLLALLREQGYRIRRVWRRGTRAARARRRMAGAACGIPARRVLP
jgi:uncharacterized protein YbaP (TraB family)